VHKIAVDILTLWLADRIVSLVPLQAPLDLTMHMPKRPAEAKKK